MTAPTLNLQSAIRAALISDATVSSIVPAQRIYDRHARPDAFPCIVIGDLHEITDDFSLARNHYRFFPTVHVWVREAGLISVKETVNAVRKAIMNNSAVRLGLAGFFYNGAQFVRDPDGQTSHGILNFEALFVEADE